MIENLKFDLVSAHLRATHPDWSADKVFSESIEISGHRGSFGCRSLESNVAEAIDTDGGPKLVQGAKKADRHPAIIEELSKHFQLQEQRKKSVELDHADRLAKIRKLMEADPSLSFDAAFTRIMQEESNASPAVKTARSAANGQGKLMLIEGGHCGLFCKLPV